MNKTFFIALFLSLILLSACSNNQEPILKSGTGSIDTTDLVAYFPLNETSGTSFAAYLGTWTNPMTSNSGYPSNFLSGSSCHDGGNCIQTWGQALETGNNMQGTGTSQTLLIWAKVSSTDLNNWDTYWGTNQALSFRYAYGSFRAQQYYSDSNWRDASISAASYLDDWHLYMVLWDRPNQRTGISVDCGTITWSSSAGLNEYSSPSQYSGIGGYTKTGNVGNGTYQHAAYYDALLDTTACDAYSAATSGGGASDSCTYASGNHTYECSDNCVLSSSTPVDASSTIIINGTGTFTGVRYITGASTIRIQGGCDAKT